MSVPDLKTLHSRYVDLSDRFRAVWAFHQFIQSVQKIFMPDDPLASSKEYQDTYAKIKALSQSLNSTEAERVSTEMEAISRQLEALCARQLEEDNKVAPHFLRQFFQRVKSYDEKILTQLVKFYLFSVGTSSWQSERLDKIDFLMTRLGEEVTDRTEPARLRDRRELRELLLGLWRVLDRGEMIDGVADGHRGSVVALRQEVGGIASLDELNDRNLIRRFRELKHSLGDLFFHPKVLEEILETNILLQNTVNRLYEQEERRIIADYQRIFELEREVPVDVELDSELKVFRSAVERFERQLEGRRVDLSDLAVVRERVKTLLPRLSQASREDSQGSSDRNTGSFSVVNPIFSDAQGAGSELSPVYERLLAALEESPAAASPKAVAVSREIFPFRLEPREVVAFRRLNTDPTCDRELERFMLQAAALRVRINEEAEEIKGILDDTSSTGEGPVFERARRTARLSDSYVHQFSHLIDRAILVSDVPLAHQLQIGRMRLMRDYSGLWLLAFRRFLRRG